MTKNKFVQLFGKAKFEICTFLFLSVSFAFQSLSPSYDSGWFETLLTLSYSRFGFHSRMLIGTVVTFFKSKIGFGDVFALHLIISVIFSLIFVLAAGFAVRKTDEDLRKYVIAFTAFYFCTPASFMITYNYTFVLDSFLYIFLLIAIICTIKNKLSFIVPVLCALAMMTHQSFIALCMPALGIIMLYSFHRTRDKKVLIFLILTCIIVAGLFVKFQFTESDIGFENADKMTDYLQQFASFKINHRLVESEYFLSNKDLFTLYIGKDIPASLKRVAVLIISMLPVIIIYEKLFIDSIKNSSEKFGKFIFLLSALLPIPAAVVYIMGTDWDRWTAFLLFEQFAVVMIFIFFKDESFIKSFTKMKDFFVIHKALFILIIFYCVTLNGLNDNYNGSLTDTVRLMFTF